MTKYTGFISVSKAAKLLQVSPDTLRNWDKEGRLVANRTNGGARRYDLVQLIALKKQLQLRSNPKNALMPVSKAATALGVSADTLRSWDQKGLIESYRTKGGARRFSRREITRLQYDLGVEAQKLGSQPQNLVIEKSRSSLFKQIRVLCLLILTLTIAALAGYYTNSLLVSNSDKLTKMQAVLGESFRPNDPNAGKTISFDGDVSVKGLLEAPNVIYGLKAGDNVYIGEGQIPTVSVNLPDFVSSFQGQNGNIVLNAGIDTSISGFTINNVSTLSSVYSRGGCGNCLSDNDIQNNITIDSDGNINAAAIKSGELPVAHGGTGLSNFSKGDLLFASAADSFGKLNIGAKGAVLTANDQGVPAWSDTLETVTVSKNLKSLGETMLGSTIVAGDLVQDGTLSLTNGNTINALPVLYFQKTDLAEKIDFFNGLVTIDKEGSMSAQAITTGELKVQANKISGAGKILVGSKTVEVENPSIGSNSRILITPTSETDDVLSVTTKEEGKKFVVSLAKPAEADISFDWLLVNEVN